MSIVNCPDCGSEMVLLHRCSKCSCEIIHDNDYLSKPTIFSKLDEEQLDFLTKYLEAEGKLAKVQALEKITYYEAKRRFDEILSVLCLDDYGGEYDKKVKEVMDKWTFDESNLKASDVVKKKLRENGGKFEVVSYNKRKHYIISALPDGKTFSCPELIIAKGYNYDIFDFIVDFLKLKGGSAPKGTGRNAKYQSEDTIIGYMAKHYFKKETKGSIYDPLFVLAAVMEKCDIAKNLKGKLVLVNPDNWSE